MLCGSAARARRRESNGSGRVEMGRTQTYPRKPLSPHSPRSRQRMVYDKREGASSTGDACQKSTLPSFLRQGDGFVLVSVRAKPGSKRAAVTGLSDDAVDLAIDAPARGAETPFLSSGNPAADDVFIVDSRPPRPSPLCTPALTAEGEANSALREFLAEVLGVRASAVSLQVSRLNSLRRHSQRAILLLALCVSSCD